MTLGIGLGAFAGGFQKGYGLGKQVNEDFAERKKQNELKSSYEISQKKFQEGLAAGTYNEDQFMDVFKSESAPIIRDHFLKQGKIKEALEWEEWSKGNKGTDYAKLYGRGRFQLGVGDYDGFANSLGALAKSAGMDDYNFTYLAGDEASPARFRVTSKDGKTVGDYTMEEAGQLYEQLFNPPSGFHYQTEKSKRDTAKATGIGNFDADEDKPTMDYDKAYKYAIDQMEVGASQEEIAKRAYEIMESSRPSRFNQFTTGIDGQPMILVDKVTGRAVASPAQTQGSNAGSANMPQQPMSGQVQEGAPLPGPRESYADILSSKGQTVGGMGLFGGMGTMSEALHKRKKESEKSSTPIPDNKPLNREQLFQKWQERKPTNEKEQAARQDEEELLRMMGERHNPERVIKAVEKKFPYHKRKLMSAEFKELYQRYTKGFTYDPRMGWRAKEPVGLGSPLPRQKPPR